MFASYRALYRDRIEANYHYSELVKKAAYHIAHHDCQPLAWLIEWDNFCYEAGLSDTPISIYPAAEAWIDAVQARMRDDAAC